VCPKNKWMGVKKKKSGLHQKDRKQGKRESKTKIQVTGNPEDTIKFTTHKWQAANVSRKSGGPRGTADYKTGNKKEGWGPTKSGKPIARFLETRKKK